MKPFHVLWLGLLVLLPSVPETVEGAKILALYNLASRSHFIFANPLARALAARGHEVTVLSPDVDKGPPIPNLKYIHLDGVYEEIREEIDVEGFVEVSLFSAISRSAYIFPNICEKCFKSKGIQEIINFPSTEKFDLIITEAHWAECFLGFIVKFGYPPVLALSAYGVVPITAVSMGSSYNPSYLPSMGAGYSPENTFLQRLERSLAHYYSEYLYYTKTLPAQEELARKYLKQDMPSFAEIIANFSIYLANTAFEFDEAMPLSPNIIPVGGMHIKSKPDPLPKDLQTFLDEAKDGFIFFSMGSNIHSDALPKEKRQAILDAFSQVRQRVLWKFESDSLEGLPPNVKIGKWLPQSDILAHPNIRMFISHCGKMSSLESIYRGVPMVGIPFFADQFFNLDKLMFKGVAVKVDYLTLTKQSLLKGIQEVLNNSSYQTNMKRLSAMLREQPVSPLDRAVYWTEYLIKHGDASHLRPLSTLLYWYQYLLIDVVLILAAGFLGFAAVVYYITKKVYNLLVRKPTDKKKTN